MGETIDQVLSTDAIDQESLRLAVREVAGEDATSLNTIARKAGIASSTFSAWLNGTYGGNNQSIAKSVRIYLASRAAQHKAKTAAVRRTAFVQTPSSDAFMALFAQAQYEPDMVTLIGAPGVGKTETCREYQRKHSNVWIMTGEPDMRTPYAVLECLAETLNIREASSFRRSRAIAGFLRGTGGLIIIDEAQNISLTALDQLRVFHDNPDVRVGLALVGHPDIKSRMLNGGSQGKYAQLDSRFGMHMARNKPLAGDVAALLDAEGITGDEERKLLRAVSNRPGALRKMSRTLRAARMIAQGQDSDGVTAAHIALADEQLNNDRGAV